MAGLGETVILCQYNCRRGEQSLLLWLLWDTRLPLPALLGTFDDQFSFPPHSQRLKHEHARFSSRRVNQCPGFLDLKLFVCSYLCACVFLCLYSMADILLRRLKS